MPLSICESVNKLGGTRILQMGMWVKLTCKYYPVELRAGAGAAISGGPSVSWPWHQSRGVNLQKKKNLKMGGVTEGLWRLLVSSEPDFLIQ